MSKWISVKDKLPPKENSKGDSISCVICEYDIEEPNFYNECKTGTAWYNYISLTWHLLHHTTSNEPINVTHWQPLPKKPKNE